MRVKTVVRFRDLKSGKLREIGEEFEVSDSRGDSLCKLGYVEPITVMAYTNKR